MGRYPVNRDDRTPAEQRPDSPLAEVSGRGSGFISYRYSCRSISSAGGRTHVQAREDRFENGKLESREFEGVMDGGVYADAVGRMQQSFLDQMKLFFRPFAGFLPFLPDDRDPDR